MFHATCWFCIAGLYTSEHACVSRHMMTYLDVHGRACIFYSVRCLQLQACKLCSNYTILMAYSYIGTVWPACVTTCLLTLPLEPRFMLLFLA